MTLFPMDGSIQRTAHVSDCGRYRYTLGRAWGDTGGTVNFLMLNPSTADDQSDDPTIRRCIDFAKRWGFAGLVVTNLFAFRATDPAAMWREPERVGPANDRVILDAARTASIVVCAWGALPPAGQHRAADVLDMTRRAGIRTFAIRLTKAGYPGHPLYIPSNLRPIPFGAEPDNLEGALDAAVDAALADPSDKAAIDRLIGIAWRASGGLGSKEPQP